MSLLGNRLKTRLIQEIRVWMINQGLEESVPSLTSKTILTEPTIYPYKIGPNLWLNTSGERWLKLLMAQGLGDCFSITPVFRSMEFEGAWHQPEFSMLEWYHHNQDLKFQMNFCQVLVTQMAKVFKYDFSHTQDPWPAISLNDLWHTYIGVSIDQIQNLSELKSLAKSRGYQIDKASWEELFNQMTIQEIYPHLPDKDPFFLTDYPTMITPLGLPNADNPVLNQRYELFIEKVEIANATVENLDSHLVETNLKQERKTRIKANLEVSETDVQFLMAIKALEGQKWSGVGLGLERLGAILTRLPMKEFILP